MSIPTDDGGASGRRLTQAQNMAVCPADGRVIVATSAAFWAWQVVHTCGHWTWEDGGFCTACGQKLRTTHVQNGSK